MTNDPHYVNLRIPAKDWAAFQKSRKRCFPACSTITGHILHLMRIGMNR